MFFGTPQAFAAYKKKKEDVYWEETTFATAEKALSLSSMLRESIRSQNRKAGHTLTHTHTDTQAHAHTHTIPLLLTYGGEGNDNQSA